MKTRTKIGLILGLLFTLTILAKIFLFSCIDDEGFCVNLSTELLGAIVTLFIVDKIITSEEEKQKQRLFSAAIKSLKNPLRHYTKMWLHINNSNENKIATELEKADSIKDYLLTKTFIDQVKSRSFNDRYTESSIPGIYDSTTLREQVPKIQEQFSLDIQRVIGNYAHVFDPETIELLQHFAETAQLYEVFNFWKAVDYGENRWFQDVQENSIREHLTAFMSLMDKYNINVSDSEKWTNNNISTWTRIYGNVHNEKW